MADTRVIVLAGDPTRMGLGHGQLLADEIRFLIGRVHHHVFRRVGPLRGAALRVVAHGLALAMNRQVPLPLRQEMKGIALGSAVRYSDILLLNTLDDVLNLLRRLAPRAPTLGCSSFALFGSRCREGRLMHGRNLDYHFRNTPLDDGGAVPRLLLRQALLFVCRPEGRAAFVSVGWPGLVGTATAMNQEGLSLGNLTSYLRGTTPHGVPVTLLYRLVMEEASTLGEVGQLLRGARRTTGNNLIVGSGRENRAALFEITRDAVMEVPPRDGLLVSTNHFVSPALAQRQRPFLLPHSVTRWRRLLALCDRYGVDLEDALAILADAGCGDECQENPFARVANEGTAVSVLFRPTEMGLWMGMGSEPPASGGGFRRIDARALLAGVQEI